MAEYPAQHDTESAKAYSALLDYIRLGKDRSLDKLRQSYGKTAAYTRQLETWSSLYAWVDRSREYDTALAEEAAQAHTARYLQDLEAHRKKASDAGAALYTVAGQLIKQLNYALSQPKKIKGEDGKWYTLHGVDLTASTFAIAARAMQTALDLDAHSLGVDKILGGMEETQE